MPIVICTIVFVLGVFGLFLGLRGRRIDRHPLCRGCGYDFSGREGVPSVCPECGRDLAGRTRAVRVGNRVRRPALAAAGAVVAILALAAGGLWIFQESQDFDLNTIKPTWWLRAEIDSADDERAGAARTELLARLGRGELTPAQTAALVDPVLNLQADPDGAWHESWGAFIQRAWQDGLVTEAQIARYLSTAVEPGLSHPLSRPRPGAGSTGGGRGGRRRPTSSVILASSCGPSSAGSSTLPGGP